MLITNADDWGGWKKATDSAYECFRQERIDSATAMVFMDDSDRGAELAKECSIDIGLHLNLNKEFDQYPKSNRNLSRHHEKVYRFLVLSKYSLILYNPLIRNSFEYVVRSQFEEFEKLYGSRPSHVDGHQHMHLATNILVDNLLPIGATVRRSFSFVKGQKSILNRSYRELVDIVLANRFKITDYFFSLSQLLTDQNFEKLTKLARDNSIELMVHPEWELEYEFLKSDAYLNKIETLKRSNFKDFAVAQITRKQ